MLSGFDPPTPAFGKPMKTLLLAALALVLASATAAAQNREASMTSHGGITIERTSDVTSVPLEDLGGKLFLRAGVNGTERSFIFDTGSPTMLSKQLASELGLEIIGERTGIDANGVPITTELAILDQLTLGDTTFRNIPILIFDFSAIPLGTCIFDGGVLGSELLPESAWRIDLDRRVMEIAETAEALAEHPKTKQAPLTLSGYPHMPVIDYSVNGFKDKALFDTGNAGTLVLFKDILGDREVNQAIKRRSLHRGRGTEGVSAGGMGQEVELHRFKLKDLRIGRHSIGAVSASTRQVPPSLIGSGMLKSNVVTLDYPGGTFSWHPREEPAPAPADQGFGVSFVDGKPLVVQLFEGSTAEKKGLRLGDEVLSLDGRLLAAKTDAERCEQLRWLIGSQTEQPYRSLTVLRNGQPVSIDLL